MAIALLGFSFQNLDLAKCFRKSDKSLSDQPLVGRFSKAQIMTVRSIYSQLARRYEKAADYAQGGSVTILTVTTMPGDDVTHPVPDNTGYITEGQFYLHDGTLDPFGSLSRLKQNVIGKETREDHSQLMNAMIRFYSGAQDAEQKQAMAFELSDYDRKLLKFGKLFKQRFMNIDVSLPLEQALDLGWKTLAECFEPRELLIKQTLIDKYFPQDSQNEQQVLTYMSYAPANLSVETARERESISPIT